MKTLTHNQQVKIRGFCYEPKITIHTLTGCAIDDGELPSASIARAKSFGHSLAPFSVKAASVIEADYPGKQARLDAAHQAYVNAVELVPGEVVEIESERYTVQVMGQDYSDPIHFVPVYREAWDKGDRTCAPSVNVAIVERYRRLSQ